MSINLDAPEVTRKPGRTFFTADTHFGHAGARALYRRPFSDVAMMDAALVAAWNETVSAGDTVWHLGDFTVRHPDPAGVLGSLNGTKHLYSATTTRRRSGRCRVGAAWPGWWSWWWTGGR